MNVHRRTTATALVAVLFLQAAIALVSCERPARAAAMALAMAQMTAHEGHHGAQRDTDLCSARCGSLDQTAGKAQFNLPDLAVHPGPVMRVAAADLALVAEPPATPVAVALGPPRRVLFQSFLL